MSKYALVMIDMQNGFIDSASPLCTPMAAAPVPACAEAITLCRTSGVPVVFALHGSAGKPSTTFLRQFHCRKHCFRRTLAYCSKCS